MGKFEVFAGSKILPSIGVPNLRGRWHIWFPADFDRHRGEYINKIKPYGFKLSDVVDGRILKNVHFDRRHDFFIRTAVGVNIMGKTMTVGFEGSNILHMDLKYRVIEVGSAGGHIYDYALLGLLGGAK